MDSILQSIKNQLGIESDYTHFDNEIIMAINAALLSINQLGIGPTTGFIVIDDTTEWSTLLGTREDIEAVKILLYFKVRLIFDPPASETLIKAINSQIEELSWRLEVQVEPPVIDGGEVIE